MNYFGWLLRAFVFVFLQVFLAGCSTPKHEVKLPSPVIPTVQGISSELDSSVSSTELSVEVSKILRKKDFLALEQKASQARTSRMRLSGGYWKLHSIYEGLDKPENKEKATDSEWAVHIARLEEWKKAIPDSITARVALAESWMTNGRQARGHGYVNTVSEENKRLFVERYENAYKELAASKDLKQKCPEWYVATLDVAIGQSWPREEFDRVFEAGFELEPTYYLLQREKLVYLLPQWFGHEGEVASFIKENSSRIQGDEGEIMYFLLLSTMQPVIVEEFSSR